MLTVVARILTALSPLWLSYRLFWLQGRHREQILGEFLRSHELDSAVGAAAVFLETFSIPILAVVACGLLWRKEKRRETTTLGITAAAALLLGVALYFTLPSMEDDLERQIREQMQGAQR
jgi:hypothetical protein